MQGFDKISEIKGEIIEKKNKKRKQ